MRIRSWSVLGAFLLLAVATPLPARAGIIELIDAWSGPGPFIGYGWEWRLACLTEPESPGATGSSPSDGIGRARLSLQEARNALRTARINLDEALAALASARARADAVGTGSRATDETGSQRGASVSQAIVRLQAARAAVEDAQQAVEEAHRNLFLGFIGPGCFLTPGARDPGKKRVASLNVGFGLYKSKDNPLFDGATTIFEGRTVSTAVRLTSVDITAWWRPYRSLEFGTGGGVMWIGGETFEPLRRVYFRPAVIDFKPIAAIRDLDRSSRNWGSKDEIVSLRVGLHVIPRGFTDADFGSTSGWRVAREVNPTVAVFFDLEPLLRKPANMRAGQ